MFLSAPEVHEEVQNLIDSLPQMINAAIAPKTKTKYERGWESWKQFCTKHKIPILPADPFYIAVFFNFLLHSKGTRGSINDAFYGIRWGHHSSGYYSPTDHPYVQLAFEGAKRLSNYSGSKKKDPMTSDMIKELVTRYYKQPFNVSHLRFLVICLLGFCGFMRIAELLSIKISDVEFFKDYMTITIEKSKTDQLREGNIIYIASSVQSQYCPLKITKEFISLSKLSKEDFLIGKLIKRKKGIQLTDQKVFRIHVLEKYFWNTLTQCLEVCV